MPDIARQWFVPGDGIDRHVISADIQRYLGNDATVRPGAGTGELQGVQGYWIKAYRNLTTAMISDLKQDSLRWRQEQQKTGGRDYAASNTFEKSAGRGTRSSPSVENNYGIPRERLSIERMPVERNPVDTRMQVDPPVAQPVRGYPQPNERNYPQDGRPYGQSERNYPPPESRTPYQMDPMSAGNYGPRPPVSAPYDHQPRYAPEYPGSATPHNGYGRPPPNDYMAPGSNQYDPTPGPIRGAPGPYHAPSPYGQQLPPARNPRDPPYAQPEYSDIRYGAYPSPASTVSSIAREPVMSPSQQQSAYGNVPQPQYDQYGGRRKF